MKGKGKAITPPPFWVWEGLATHTPAAAELAAQAADVASAARYFEVRSLLRLNVKMCKGFANPRLPVMTPNDGWDFCFPYLIASLSIAIKSRI